MHANLCMTLKGKVYVAKTPFVRSNGRGNKERY